MLYLLLAMALFGIAFQLYRLAEMKKHDQHLFELCQLRRDAIRYLSNAYEDLTRTDYIALRKINDALSTMIASYSEQRTVIFNLKRFSVHLDELKTFENKAKNISTSNTEIQNLLNRIHHSIFKAFLAFTPRLKSELAFTLELHLITFGVRAGINSLKGYLLSLKEAKMMVNAFKQSTAPC
ncbi:hypothetical protein [Microbulbifer sp. 2205BS26-8]|uniref:hypothetical protein n=1 Tax=Microbulbifer sp. 2205BS26-8 TaxID=3064386 RepID=UPI00273F8EC8|nr:hypothetical protein [Microbulbifer sp. 2205BS26-8]MDP5208576.1 hypothetical protein [Microbulbifer sp. 2205BS26-8]